MKKEYYTKGKTVGKEQLGWQGERALRAGCLLITPVYTLATDVTDKKNNKKKLLQFLTFHISQMFQQFLALGFNVKWLMMGMWQQNVI